MNTETIPEAHYEYGFYVDIFLVVSALFVTAAISTLLNVFLLYVTVKNKYVIPLGRFEALGLRNLVEPYFPTKCHRAVASFSDVIQVIL